MDDKLFNQHFGGSPAPRESTVLKPEADTPARSIRRGASEAMATGKIVIDALSNRVPAASQSAGNTGGPRYDRYRAKPFQGN